MSINPILRLNEILLLLSPLELTTLAFVIGVISSEGLDYNGQQAIGNFVEMVGQTMLTIGAQGQNLDENNNSNYDIDNAINLLKNKIGNIENIIAELKSL